LLRSSILTYLEARTFFHSTPFNTLLTCELTEKLEPQRNPISRTQRMNPGISRSRYGTREETALSNRLANDQDYLMYSNGKHCATIKTLIVLRANHTWDCTCGFSRSLGWLVILGSQALQSPSHTCYACSLGTREARKPHLAPLKSSEAEWAHSYRPHDPTGIGSRLIATSMTKTCALCRFVASCGCAMAFTQEN
jgi:hypothetical protein